MDHVLTLAPLEGWARQGGGGSAEVGGVAGWAVGLMESFGVIGAGIAIALENVFPPVPSEVILPLAGFTASRGEFGLVSVLIATTAGSVLGAVLLYVLGRVLGEDRLRAVAAKVPLLRPDDWSSIGPYASAFQWLVLGATALAIAVFATRRLRASRS